MPPPRYGAGPLSRRLLALSCAVGGFQTSLIYLRHSYLIPLWSIDLLEPFGVKVMKIPR